MIQNEDFDKSVESNDDQLLNEETTDEISTENEIQIPIGYKIHDNFSSSDKEDKNECNSSETNVKIFLSGPT